MSYQFGVCTFCGTGCGHFLKTAGDVIEGVYPAEKHPVSKGRLCVRGWHIHELLRNSDRLTQPLIRVDDELVETSYENALSFLSDRIKKAKPDPVSDIGFLASPRSSNEEQYLLMRIARQVLGTGNISLDSEGWQQSSLEVINEGTGFPGMTGSAEEIDKTDFIMVVDFDITRQNPIIGSEIHLAAMAGTKVVTVDSRQTQIAKLSSDFLQVRPGSTEILMGALARIIIDEELVDLKKIKSSVSEYEQFKKAATKLELSAAIEKTGIEETVLRETARSLAKAESGMVFFPTGISGITPATVKMIFNLFLLAGKVGTPASGVNPVPGINNLQGGIDMGAVPNRLTGFQDVRDSKVIDKFQDAWGGEFCADPGQPIYELIKKHPKLLFVVDHDEGIIKNADDISKSDTVVYIGAYNNPFTKLADIVLPITPYVETAGTYTTTGRRVQLSTQKLKPTGGVKPGWEVLQMIAASQGHEWKYENPAEIMLEIASLTPNYKGISHDRLRSLIGGIQWPCNDEYPNGCKSFDSSKAKQVLKFVAVGNDPTPVEPTEDFPWLLMVGKAMHFWHQNNLMKKTFIPNREFNAELLLYPNGFVEVSREDAEKLEIRNGWNVNVVSPSGSVEVKVKVSGDVKSGTAYMPYFVKDMVSQFLLQHKQSLELGENASVPVRIEAIR